MKIKKTLVNFILDKSGSMDSVKDATISGFNEYVSTLKKDEKSEYEFTLTCFDHRHETLYRSRPIKEVTRLNSESYQPNGNTALYDAVVSTIRNTKVEHGQKVLNVIMTDGEENASQTYTEKDMRLLIDTLQNNGNWTFLFLGANQDSYKNAARFGISSMNTVNFASTGASVNNMMRSMAVNTSSYAASASSSTDAFFSKADQDNISSTK